MERIEPEDLHREADAIEAAALATEGVDRFCSGPDWGAAGHQAWDPALIPQIWRGAGGYAAFLEETFGDRTVLTPFDRMWGYSCPLISGDPATLAREFSEWAREPSAAWDLIFISGLHEASALWTQVVHALYPHFTLSLGLTQHRWCAALQGGIDGYLGRRSAKMRRELLRQERRAAEEGVQFERGAGSPGGIYERILAVEDRSWKADEETGLHIDEMRDFYRVLIPRLHARDRLRVLFARIGDIDVGYILGGVAGDLYRGLQFSFDNAYRPLGLGNVLQLKELRSLCEEHYATYDLGIDIAYKARWADERVDTETLVVHRRMPEPEPE